MRFVQRDNDGKLTGHFACEQTFAREAVPDDHPDILAWEADRKAQHEADRRDNSPMARITKLEAELERLRKKLGE